MSTPRSTRASPTSFSERLRREFDPRERQYGWKVDVKILDRQAELIASAGLP